MIMFGSNLGATIRKQLSSASSNCMGDYGRDHQYAAIRSIANALELRYPLDPKGVHEGSLFKDTLTF